MISDVEIETLKRQNRRLKMALFSTIAVFIVTVMTVYGCTAILFEPMPYSSVLWRRLASITISSTPLPRNPTIKPMTPPIKTPAQKGAPGIRSGTAIAPTNAPSETLPAMILACKELSLVVNRWDPAS